MENLKAEKMSNPTERLLTMNDLLHMCAVRWRWFLVSILVCMVLAVRSILTAPYLYSRSASVMVREDAVGNNVTDKNSKDFSELGFVNQKNNLADLIRHISSLEVLAEVAKRRRPQLTDSEALIAAGGLKARLLVEGSKDKSNIIDITYKDYSTTDAGNVLSLIIEVFNEKWIQNKQDLIRSTSRFIDSKLRMIESELSTVDDSIASYKSNYGITDLASVSDVYLHQQSQTDAEMLKLLNQKAMAEYIRSLLEDGASHEQLLLVNSGINNTLIESQITLYNSLLLQMQSHMEYTSGQNPLIVNLEKELTSLRKNILSNVINHIRTIDIQLQSLEEYHKLTTAKIMSNPEQAKHLISIEREQKVKESLYMFLLQKKEENEVSLTYQSAPLQILDKPHGSGKPTSPKRMKALLSSFIIGLIIPLSIIFFRTMLDDTVRDRLDLEMHGNIAVLGEIPLIGQKQKLRDLLHYPPKKPVEKTVVVEDGKQDAINEAFRMVRTRLEQGGLQQTNQQVYVVSSTEQGAGKTFVAMNLALALAIAGRRILFIDGDLRTGRASRRWDAPTSGLTEFLNSTVTSFDSLLYQYQHYTTLDILPSGTLPANPTELLNGRLMVELLSSARPRYDYIIIDTPPAGSLADAEIITRFADCTVDVIRARKYQRRKLGDLAQRSAQIKNLRVVLNGVSDW